MTVFCAVQKEEATQTVTLRLLTGYRLAQLLLDTCNQLMLCVTTTMQVNDANQLPVLL